MKSATLNFRRSATLGHGKLQAPYYYSFYYSTTYSIGQRLWNSLIWSVFGPSESYRAYLGYSSYRYCYQS
jgi:hypothetical protein